MAAYLIHDPKRQGISPEEFIVQTLTEKIRSLQTGLRQKEGVLVFETESLDHIDFNALIAQIREERDWEQMGLSWFPSSCLGTV